MRSCVLACWLKQDWERRPTKPEACSTIWHYTVASHMILRWIIALWVSRLRLLCFLGQTWGLGKSDATVPPDDLGIGAQGHSSKVRTVGVWFHVAEPIISSKVLDCFILIQEFKDLQTWGCLWRSLKYHPMGPGLSPCPECYRTRRSIPLPQMLAPWRGKWGRCMSPWGSWKQWPWAGWKKMSQWSLSKLWPLKSRCFHSICWCLTFFQVSSTWICGFFKPVAANLVLFGRCRNAKFKFMIRK